MKDYLKILFSFSRKELNGLLVLIVLLILLLAGRWATVWFVPRPKVDFSAFEKEVAWLLRDTPAATSSVKRGRSVSRDTIALFSFDPNTVSRAGLLKLGLRSRTADVLINFRAAGGTFRKREDLAKIYGLRDELYNRLLPYIRIPEKKQIRSGKRVQRRDQARNENQARRKKQTRNARTGGNAAGGSENTDGACSPLEINGATPADLLPLRGIGPVLSERIVRYRERLGGFHSVGQLLEVYGIDTAAFMNFRDCLGADPSLIDKININVADFGELRRLPYWSPAQVNVLLNYRQQHGPFSRVNALYNIRALEEHTIQKVIPYLKVNQNQSKNE